VTNWRLYILGGLLACLFAVAFYIAHLQTEARVAKKAATDARAQTVVSEGVASAVDRTIIRERTITQEVQNVVREIDQLPTGDALVPEDVADAWSSGIDSLQHDAAKPDSDGSK
jgi:predicted outer membrane lipoprotein